MSKLDGFEALVAVVEAGSIAQGARDLGMARPTLSRQIARLEASLGVRLLHRSTRLLKLTTAGEEFFERARRVVTDAEAARTAVEIADDVPRGLVRLSIPADVRGAATQILFSFLERFPAVQLEVVASARFVDLVAEGFDAALRGGILTEDGIVARRLLSVDHRVFASPAYLAGRGPLNISEDLQHHNCVRLFARGTVPQTHWPLRAGGRIAVQGTLSTNSLLVIEDAIRAGLGVGLLPYAPADLKPVLEDEVGETGHLAIVYPERRLLAPGVRALVDHFVDNRSRLTLR